MSVTEQKQGAAAAAVGSLIPGGIPQALVLEDVSTGSWESQRVPTLQHQESCN